LFDAVFDGPHFRPVVEGCKTDDDELQQRLVGDDFDFVMELSDERAELFEKGDSDCFEIRLGFTIGLNPRIGGGNALDILIEANRFGIGRELPLGRAEQYADVPGVELHNTGRDRICLDGLIQRRENDRIFRHVNDDASACEVGDYFLLARGVLRDEFGTQASRDEADR
jgi:hypothetical protein